MGYLNVNKQLHIKIDDTINELYKKRLMMWWKLHTFVPRIKSYEKTSHKDIL